MATDYDMTPARVEFYLLFERTFSKPWPPDVQKHWDDAMKTVGRKT